MTHNYSRQNHVQACMTATVYFVHPFYHVITRKYSLYLPIVQKATPKFVTKDRSTILNSNE